MTSSRLEPANRRDALIEVIREHLAQDDRVISAWLHGSIGRGDSDAWSDIDLVVLVEDEHYHEFWVDRQSLFDAIGEPLLRQRPIPGNSIVPGGNFQLVVFAGPVEVDWTVAPASGVSRPANTNLLFQRQPIPIIEPTAPVRSESEVRDRIEFFWAMAPVAVKYAVRDDMLRTAGMISVLRDTLHGNADRPILTRLNRQIALIEIQHLCSEAVDPKYAAIANEVNRLIALAAE